MSTLERSARHRIRTIDVPIGSSGLLAACSRRELAQIARRCDVVEVEGGVPVQALQPLHWIYLVMDGLLAASNSESSFIVGSDGAIGVRSAMACRMPLVSIVAMNDSTLLTMPIPDFVGLVGTLRGLTLGTARHLARGPALL